MTTREKAVPAQYSGYIGRKMGINIAGILVLALLIVLSISIGPVSIPFVEVVRTLFRGLAGLAGSIGGSGSADGAGSLTGRVDIIVFQIRLPQTLAAVASGAGLAVSGAVMQSILRNPLGSPFTLGISNAAAFGAAFSVMVLGTGAMQSGGSDAVTLSNPYITTLSAFFFCVITAAVILGVAKVKRSSPEVMVLTGIALGALYSAGTMFLQYFADDVQLAAMVFWTFGDLARANWGELSIIAAVTLVSFFYFMLHRWNYNALNTGDETAKSLGVAVGRIRLVGMVTASLVTAVIISFVGVIGFVGLICPHMVRRVVGDDHRFLLSGSALMGAILLTAADTAARVVMSPHVLPVAILTAFLGAPAFIYLLIRGYRR